MSDLIVTIDGPAGAGKSCVAKRLASALSWTYLDTGAMYRSVAYLALHSTPTIAPNDSVALEHLMSDMQMELQPRPEGVAVLLHGEDVTTAIRTPDVSQMASMVSVHPGVRSRLVDLQRAIGSHGRLVTEGRDQGSVVFPAARFKFFLTASAEERAKRRLKDLGGDADFEKVLAEIVERDERDSTREASPLVQAKDATLVDTTGMTIDQVVATLQAKVVAGVGKP